MSAPATETITPRPAPAARLQPSSMEVDRSCRATVLFLLTCSVLWLVFALAAAVLGSIKSHAPGMLADIPALTFGRVVAASSSAFYYGFASQAGIAISLWLFARMGRTLLVMPRASIVAGLIWNLGVLIGIGGIFGGGMTHYPGFEMPTRVFPIFFAAFAILGIAAILTFHARTERQVYPANWFLFAAFFVFPWIYSTAGMMLGNETTRAVMQPVVSIWFFNNFIWLWLGSIALGILFYFISKLSGQPLHSYGTAAFGFWFYILFVNGSGFQNVAGLPVWMSTLSRVLNVLLLLPVFAIAYNWYYTWAGHNRQKKQKDPASKYIVFSAAAFVLSVSLLAIVSCPIIDEVLGFSIFMPGLVELITFGFVGMAFFGAITHIVPRLVDADWPKASLGAWHYRLTAAGLVISAGALMFGGYVHGSAMNNLSVDFLSAARRAVPFIGVSTIGLLLFLIGQVLLLIHMGSILKYCCAECRGGRAGKEVNQ